MFHCYIDSNAVSRGNFYAHCHTFLYHPFFPLIHFKPYNNTLLIGVWVREWQRLVCSVVFAI